MVLSIAGFGGKLADLNTRGLGGVFQTLSICSLFVASRG